ncbi:hypothetical protein Q8F55_004731 [Vanrija albida]|uniref:Uncharacterized protein n=1 Tax=Vanrija albida TaxID=181172 RepID=A0ABR3PZL2_9TREE
MVGNVFKRFAIGVLLFSIAAQAQDSASPSPTSPDGEPATSGAPSAPAPGPDAAAPSGSGGPSGAGSPSDGGAGGPGGSGPPPAEVTTVPDSSSLSHYKPNINVTYSVGPSSPLIDLFPDFQFYGNHTHVALWGEWNFTTSNPPQNLSNGGQTALGPLSARFNANPVRRTWGLSEATQATIPSGMFSISHQFNFAGTRAIVRGNYTNVDWAAVQEAPMVVIWSNTTAKTFTGSSGRASPARIENVTSPFPQGIIYDTGELEYGRYALQFYLYNGTLEIESLDIDTGPSLEEVPQTTVKAVDADGKPNPFFNVQGTSKVLNEVLGEEGGNASTVEWNSLDFSGTMTFKSLPNATFMVINGTRAPEYDILELQILPVPPAAWVMGNDGVKYVYSPYRNPALYYTTPLDPKIEYTISVMGAVIPNQEVTVPTPGVANIHSVTFFAGSRPVDPPPSNTTSDNDSAAASHGESRASRNAKIIGGAVGGGVGLLLILGLLAFCCIRRKRKPSPVISSPTPFDIDGSRQDGTARIPSDDDEAADKVPEELTPAQVAKAREAGFLGAGAASSDGPRRWTWRQPPSGPVSAFDSAMRPPVSEAGVSAVPSSVLDPRGAVPFTRGPASAVPSSVMIPHLGGPASVAASSSLEPSDAIDSRFYNTSTGEGSSTGAGSSSMIASPTSTQINGIALKDTDAAAAILATPVHGDKRVHQAEDGGAVDEDDNVDMIPPSYNPSWASRGAPLADSGAVTRVASDSDGAAAIAEDRIATVLFFLGALGIVSVILSAGTRRPQPAFPPKLLLIILSALPIPSGVAFSVAAVKRRFMSKVLTAPSRRH